MEESWKIFDIQLAPQQKYGTIPEEIQGNWLRTDGSNEWTYGFYENLVVFNNEFWDSIRVENKGKKYQLALHKDGRQENIHLKLKKDKLYIGRDPGNLELFSRAVTHNSSYVIRDNNEFQMSFKADTAIYKGYIKGYHPKMGSTGTVYVNDLLAGEQKSNLIRIAPNGTFEAKVPMLHPQNVFVSIQRINESVLLEPGQTTLHYIDIAEYTAPYKNYAHRSKRKRNSLFMGSTARVNADLQSMDSISYYNYDQARKKILEMSADEYKAYCLNLLKKEQNALNNFIQSNQVSKKAIQLKKLEIPYRIYENILSYNMSKESAYRQKHKIPRDQREIPLKREELKPDYFDFIDPADLNNPVSFVTGGAYYILINRIKFADVVREQPKFNQIYINLKKRIIRENIALTADQTALLDRLIGCVDSDSVKNITKADSAIWTPFYEDNKELFASVGRTMMAELRNQKMKEFFGLSEGMASDIMLAQDGFNTMQSQSRALSAAELQEVKDKISSDFISAYIVMANEVKAAEIARILEENKTKTGYVVNETPETEADQLFDAIIEKYKGKVVFVDFWATWCGPCRSGMERMKPLKEALKGKNIEFVYITNHTSPLDTWNMLIPDIKGEHFRVNSDEWNILSSKFNITGIPHYVLVDKNSNVVQNKVYFSSSNDQLRDLFEPYLE